MSDRIHNQISIHFDNVLKKQKEMIAFRYLKKAIDKNANGTRKYVLKQGINKGKVV